MPARKHISPADNAFGHFNKFGAVVIDFVQEPEPEPAREDEPPVEIPRFDITELGPGEKGGEKSLAAVSFNEDYTIYEDHRGEIVRADSAGRLIISNYGSRDRMYDLMVSLKNTAGTTLSQSQFAPVELQPRTRAEMEYDIARCQNLLDITEKISTHPEDADAEEVVPNHLLVAGARTKVLFELKVANTSGHRVEDLTVRKEISEAFGEYQLLWIQGGGTRLTGDEGKFRASVQGGEIAWKIGSLGAGEQTTMRFFLDFTPIDVQPRPTGYVKASYIVNSNLSGVALNEFRALTKNIYSLRIEEVNEPGFWNCSMIFHNISEFPVLLTHAYVSRTDTDTVFLDIKDYPKLLHPETIWESNSWQIKDIDRPRLTNLVNFRVMPEVYSVSRVNVVQESSQLTIASLAGRKSYDRPTIPSFAETDVRTTIVLQNQGTGSLNEITIKDVIPTPFRPPEPRDVMVVLNDTPLDETSYSLSLTPKDFDHLKDHVLAVSLVNLKDTLGTFDPGHRIVLEYTARAVRPEPETVLKGIIEMSGRGYPAGDKIITQIPQEVLPVINVEHSLRKYTIGKAVEPAGEVGNYVIELLFQNDGKTVLKDVVIRDPIPYNFEIGKAEPAASELDDGQDKAIIWRFDALEPGTRMTFKYTIRGVGEYRSSDAQVSLGS